MSRSGYSDSLENWDLIRWRGQVVSAIRGKRGQQLLKELADALDAMPDKKLIAHELKSDAGYCALGVIGEKRGLNLELMDPEQPDTIAEQFDIAHQLCKEIVFQNDEACQYMTPESRWKFMRQWVSELIKPGYST